MMAVRSNIMSFPNYNFLCFVKQKWYIAFILLYYYKMQLKKMFDYFLEQFRVF